MSSVISPVAEGNVGDVEPLGKVWVTSRLQREHVGTGGLRQVPGLGRWSSVGSEVKVEDIGREAPAAVGEALRETSEAVRSTTPVIGQLGETNTGVSGLENLEKQIFLRLVDIRNVLDQRHLHCFLAGVG